ncbi:MAG: DEAD/DEAH box helicase [Candidatus Woesearchaeota archaeon]
MNFEELGVRPKIVKALTELGIKEPTSIQKETIPLIRAGKDIIGKSKTGSGKTAAFGVPILEQITPGGGLQVLIMAPIRELAVQIADELDKFGKYLDFSVTTIFGGVGMGPQIEGMKRSEIIVGTPGRLLDHLQRGNMDLSKMKHVVLDEADKMVDMGFIEDVDRILQAMPKQKQVLLFGATISDEVNKLKNRHMVDPQIISAESQVKAEFLEQHYYNIEAHEKFSLLVHLLKNEPTSLSIIFCAKRTTVEMVAHNLKRQGIKAEMIHGKLSQNRRLSVMADFKKGKPNVLVASAVAARGIDIRDVTHVFNYDLSQDPQEYIHRVGRTARAGETGKAITLLSPQDHDTFNSILRFYDVRVEAMPRINFQKLQFDAGRSRRDSGDSGRGFGRVPRRYQKHADGGRDGGRAGGSGYGSQGSRPPRSGGYSSSRSPRIEERSDDSLKFKGRKSWNAHA